MFRGFANLDYDEDVGEAALLSLLHRFRPQEDEQVVGRSIAQHLQVIRLVLVVCRCVQGHYPLEKALEEREGGSGGGREGGRVFDLLSRLSLRAVSHSW